MLRAVFYFAIALPITLFGLLSGLSTLGSDTPIVFVALVVTSCCLLMSIRLFSRRQNWGRHLHWSSFILATIGATMGAFLAFCLEIILLPDGIDKPLGTAITCCIITLYGLALEGLALW